MSEANAPKVFKTLTEAMKQQTGQVSSKPYKVAGGGQVRFVMANGPSDAAAAVLAHLGHDTKNLIPAEIAAIFAAEFKSTKGKGSDENTD